MDGFVIVIVFMIFVSFVHILIYNYIFLFLIYIFDILVNKAHRIKVWICNCFHMIFVSFFIF